MSVTAPAGFRAAGVTAGLKTSGAPDLALVVNDGPTFDSASVFTANRCQANPVLWSREVVRDGVVRAVVLNSGGANCYTGPDGFQTTHAVAEQVAGHLGIGPIDVVVCSTGLIGLANDRGQLLAGVDAAYDALDGDGGPDAARAIMTTDTRAKETVVDFALGGRTARVGGMAKGAGMIAPRMATLLAFFTTDAAVDAGLLQDALREAVGSSLNRITVDGDTSTNDMAVVLAGGALPERAILAPGPDYDAFRAALTEAARRLAEMIVRDGEGATRIAEVRVEGAASGDDADRVARAIAESPLVKTALHGGDPNWGRILAAAGRSGVPVDMDRVDIHLGDVWVAEGGAARDYDESAAHAAVTADPVRIVVRLNAGTASGWMWTCDLSRGYVDINAHYRS